MGSSRKLFYENVRVGDDLPPLTRPAVDRATFARYAGAAEDYNPLHVDDDYARRAGFPGTFAHGTMLLGWLGSLGSDYLRGGQLRRLSARFIKIVWPGESLTCCGRVVEKRREGGEYWVDLDLWVENQKGELVAKGSASGKLFHSPEDEERQHRGLPPLIVEDDDRPSLAEVFEREMGLAGAPAVHRGGTAPRRPLPAPAPAPAASKRPALKAAPAKGPAPKAAPGKRPAPRAVPAKRPAPRAVPAKRPAPKAVAPKRPARASASKRPAPKPAARGGKPGRQHRR